MKTTLLGRTGVTVSRICLGCMSYGEPDRGSHPWTLGESASRPFLRRALDLGINFFDTANVYSDGSSEEIVGRALLEYAGRQQVVIATKVHGRMHAGANGAGLSRKAIFGEIDATDDFSEINATFEAQIASISTNNEARDGHLKSEEFFAADQYPTLTFVSTGLTKKDDERFVLHGDLSLRGVTKPVALNVEYGGTTTDPYGNVKAGFEVQGKINRKDFGLTWGVVTEAGGAVVSDEVGLVANIQVVKQG